MKNSLFEYAALLLGMTWQMFYQIKDTRKFLKTIFGIASFTPLILLYAINKDHSLWSNPDYWLISLLMAWVVGALILLSDKPYEPIKESRALLHSIVLMYWTLTISDTLYFYPLLLFSIPTLIFNIQQALSVKLLSKYELLIQSIWSSVVIAVFTLKYVLGVISLVSAREAYIQWGTIDAIIILLEYFFLGASGAYLLLNLGILFDYFPAKKKIYSSYEEQINASNELYLNRYSREQVSIKDGLVIIITSSIFLLVNLFYNIVSDNLAVWLVMVFAPIVINHLPLNKPQA